MIKFTDIVEKPVGKSAAKSEADAIKAKVLRDIGVKWDRLSEDDLAKVKNSEQLSKMLVERYGLEDGQAHRDVRAFLNGRHF